MNEPVTRRRVYILMIRKTLSCMLYRSQDFSSMMGIKTSHCPHEFNGTQFCDIWGTLRRQMYPATPSFIVTQMMPFRGCEWTLPIQLYQCAFLSIHFKFDVRWMAGRHIPVIQLLYIPIYEVSSLAHPCAQVGTHAQWWMPICSACCTRDSRESAINEAKCGSDSLAVPLLQKEDWSPLSCAQGSLSHWAFQKIKPRPARKNPRWVRKHHLKMKELKARETWILIFVIRFEKNWTQMSFVWFCAGRPFSIANVPPYPTLRFVATCPACTYLRHGLKELLYHDQTPPFFNHMIWS